MGAKNGWVLCGQLGMTAAKNDKNDLQACSERGTTPSNSPGDPKTQGCSLREIERKIGWSVGCDHPPNAKKIDLIVGFHPGSTPPN
jgi:hypothetical protein